MRLVPLLLVCLAGGCYQIDGDVTGLSASAGVESFDAAGTAAGTSVAIDRLIRFDGTSLAATVQKARIDAVRLAPASGVRSLDFLSSLTLILHAPGGDIPLIDAAGKMTAADGTVTLPVNVDVDPALLLAPMEIATSIRFVAPAEPWAVRMTALLSVQGHADVHP